MRVPFFRSFGLASIAALSFSTRLWAETIPVDNPGFEEDTTGWIIQEKDQAQPMSSISEEEAHTGSKCLRVNDQDPKLGSNVASRPIPIEAGQTYKLSFFARTKKGGTGAVYLRFADGKRAVIDPKAMPMAAISRGSQEWEPYSVTAKAPDGAATVSIWIHTWSGAMGLIDFDDFALEKVEGAEASPSAPSAGQASPAAAIQTAANPTPAAPPEATSTTSAPSSVPAAPPAVKPRQAMTARTKPATIIIKVDDLKTGANGHLPVAWDRFADLIKQRHLKAGIGIICNSLEGDKPAYFQWIKDQKATGLFEFWNHGYDHLEWKEGDKTLHEFQGPPYETQKEHVTKSQNLAKEKLGFPLATFGPGYGATDDSTVRVLQEDPDTKIWLYSKPLEVTDKLPDGKVILDRVWQVNIEHPTFVPSFEMFKAGYEKFPRRDYFVIQGHPSHWKEEGWAEFTKILDFLQEQGAVFMTPTEYVAAHPKPETMLVPSAATP